MHEDDALIWSICGTMLPRKRFRLLRALRRQCAADLTDAEAQVIAPKRSPLLIDNTLSDDMLGGKQGV